MVSISSVPGNKHGKTYKATDPELGMDLTVADMIIPTMLLQNEK